MSWANPLLRCGGALKWKGEIERRPAWSLSPFDFQASTGFPAALSDVKGREFLHCLRRSERSPSKKEALMLICWVTPSTRARVDKEEEPAASSGGGPASWTRRWWRPRPGRGRSGCSWEKGLGTIPSWSRTSCTRTSGSFSAICSEFCKTF